MSSVTKRILTAAICVVILGIVILAFNYVQKGARPSRNQYVQSYTTFSIKGVTAIPEIQSAVEQAQKSGTADDVAGAKMVLATALFSRNQGDDRQQAATTLKEIIADQGLSAATRASAYSYMANWLYTYGSQDLMKQYVFNTSPYSNYLEQQKGDVTEATVYLLTLANNLQVNAFNNYESAGMLAYKLRGMGINPSDKGQLEVAQRAQAYVVAGDDLFRDTQRSEFYKKNPGSTLFLLAIKAISLATLQPYFPDSIPNTKVMDAFETALGAIAAAQNSLPAKFTASNARLEYAIWLMQAKNIADLDGNIRTVMKPIGAGQSEAFDAYIKNVQSRAATSYVKKGVIRVAAVSADFKAYLKSQGWQDADFASK